MGFGDSIPTKAASTAAAPRSNWSHRYHTAVTSTIENEIEPDPSDIPAADDDAIEVEGLQSPIKHLEDGVWHAPRGPGTKITAWAILIGLAVCFIGLIVMLVASATG